MTAFELNAPLEIRTGARFGSMFPSLNARFQKIGGADKVAASIVQGQRDKR